MAPHRPFDPSLLDAIEESVVEWRGMVYRQVFEGTDVLRANIRGARWNPSEVEALYCALQSRTAAAEIDHLINRQPVDPGDNLVVFVNNMAPTDGIEPVSQEVYVPTS